MLIEAQQERELKSQKKRQMIRRGVTHADVMRQSNDSRGRGLHINLKSCRKECLDAGECMERNLGISGGKVKR